MKIICTNCRTKYKIPDGKIPAGESVKVPCPNCSHSISLGSAKKTSESTGRINHDQTDDAHDKSPGFVEDEGQTALVCEQNPLMRKTVTRELKLLGYQIVQAESARDALKRMRYQPYDIIVVNEEFDADNPATNGILIYLERLAMTARRNMFVIMLADRYRTMDNMMAMNKSVNLIVNVKNIDDIGKILSRSITDNACFYSVFRQTLKKIGRA
jgi:predicted Zn finger-like uncharacterized protein